MKIYELRTSQKIKAPIHTIWDYFSSPGNLKNITPAYMGFKVLDEDKLVKMYQGQIIQYKVKPILNIPIHWVTEITHCQEGKFFVDEQRFGPYKLWHHQHHFTQKDNHVLMEDIVTYALPFGPLGAIAQTLFIKNQLKNIFQFRYSAVEKHFENSAVSFG